MVARCSSSNRPSAQAVQAASAVSSVTQARNPSRPRLTPITGTSQTSAVRAAWMKVPSPPKVTTSCLPSTRAGSRERSPSPRPGSPVHICRWKSSTSWPCSASLPLARTTAGLSALTRAWRTKRTSGMGSHVHEILLVALGANDVGGRRAEDLESFVGGPRDEARERFVAIILAAHHAALANPAAAELKLRLEQDQDLATGCQQAPDRWHHQAQGDEAEIAHRKVRHRPFQRSQVADVGAFDDHHALILTQPPGKLPVPDVDRVDQACAALQEGVGEPAG